MSDEDMMNLAVAKVMANWESIEELKEGEEVEE